MGPANAGVYEEEHNMAHELNITERKARLLDHLEDPTISKLEIEKVQQKLDILDSIKE